MFWDGCLGWCSAGSLSQLALLWRVAAVSQPISRRRRAPWEGVAADELSGPSDRHSARLTGGGTRPGPRGLPELPEPAAGSDQ